MLPIAGAEAAGVVKTYRFGFNGKEKDDQVAGDENTYTTEFRQYDSRLGRWLSVDPLFNLYPSITPFAFSANNPIIYVDDDGRKIKIYYKDNNGKTKSYVHGSKQTVPNNRFVQQTIQSLNHIKQSDQGVATKIEQISSSNTKHLKLKESKKGAIYTHANLDLRSKSTGKAIPEGASVNTNDVVINSGTIPFNPNEGLKNPTTGETISPATILAHEIGHVWAGLFKTLFYIESSNKSDIKYHDEQENLATTAFEHKVAKANGEWLRLDHTTGVSVTTVSPTETTPASVVTEEQLGKGNSVEFKRK